MQQSLGYLLLKQTSHNNFRKGLFSYLFSTFLKALIKSNNNKKKKH